ncbi:UNVERIFIED_CONTAM: hypothetical protein Slati_0176400 [Sesamum latifolium]|uniref:Uncharacterized protein n=1 Tax=Sesamum latifolium TaxID=2727402 RepID=A0AAW2YAW1_9LAMI
MDKEGDRRSPGRWVLDRRSPGRSIVTSSPGCWLAGRELTGSLVPRPTIWTSSGRLITFGKKSLTSKISFGKDLANHSLFGMMRLLPCKTLKCI